MQGTIFNIQKFSIHDGPGIRTTVFLKGCPLRCRWCANPESQLSAVQIVQDSKKCIGCLACVKNCPVQALHAEGNVIYHHPEACIHCFSCIRNCPAHALSAEGEVQTVEEIVRICEQDRDFYEESQGGVTISGGEGMAQPEFCLALAQALQERKIHTAIETTGCAAPEVFQKLAPYFDLLLFDVKHAGCAKHLAHTGVGNEQILENLSWAAANQLNVLPRIPVIPGFNDTLPEAEALAELLLSMGLKKVQLLPFHPFGENKYRLLHRRYAYEGVPAWHPEDLKDYQQVFLDKGLKCWF